jgi:predicted ester cyclase
MPAIDPSLHILLEQFYSLLNATTDPDADVLGGVVADGWRNTGSAGTARDRHEYTAAVMGLRQAVPDLTWTIDEILVADNRVTVRGHGCGTPIMPLFGVEPTGGSFNVLSIDIHTINDRTIASTFHLEDWAAAIEQLQHPR